MSDPPHLRPRWRYLAVEIETEPDAAIDRRTFQRACWSAVRSLLGDASSASLDATVVRFRFEDGDGYAIVRTTVAGVADTRAALACLAEVDGRAVGCRVTGVSGTIQACLEEQVVDRSAPVKSRTAHFDGQDRETIRRGDRLDVRIGGSFVGATVSEAE